MKRCFAFILAMTLCFSLCACGNDTAEDTTPTETEAPIVEDDGIMKILLIGHSLGNDSSFMFPDVARNEGMEKLVIGVVYHSGCRIVQHLDYAKADAAQYAYYEYDISKDQQWQRADCNGNFLPYTPGMANDSCIEDGSIAQTLKFSITRHDWDLVILQAGFWESADTKDSYYTKNNKELNITGHIQELMDYVNEQDIEKATPNKFAWNMIWSTPADPAARKDSTSQMLITHFRNDDHVLYQAQAKLLKDTIEPAFDWVYVFPNGTTIENLKTTKLADNEIFRDYGHVTDFGRLVAAYTWYCVLTDTAITDCKLAPINHKVLLDGTARAAGIDWVLTEEQKNILVEAVGNAIKSPYDTIPSQYTE